MLLGAALPMQIVAAESPNVLIIIADDVGCDALACTGAKSARTPASELVMRSRRSTGRLRLATTYGPNYH